MPLNICAAKDLRRFMSWSIWVCLFLAQSPDGFINAPLAVSQKTLVRVVRLRVLALLLIERVMLYCTLYFNKILKPAQFSLMNGLRLI